MLLKLLPFQYSLVCTGTCCPHAPPLGPTAPVLYFVAEEHTYHTKGWPPSPPGPPAPGLPWWPSAPPRPPCTSQEAANSRCVQSSSTYIVMLPPSPPGAPCDPRPALIVLLEFE